MSSNLSAIPEALLHLDLPKGLSRVNFHKTNLSAIQEDIDTHWGKKEWTYLGFSGCNISSIPPAMGKLSLLLLSLQENHIESIPDALFKNHFLGILAVSKNPLRDLPDSAEVASSTNVFEIVASDTNISSIPNWLHERATLKRITSSTLINTPFCDSLLEKTAALDSSLDMGDSLERAEMVASQLCVAKDARVLTLDPLLPQRQP